MVWLGVVLFLLTKSVVHSQAEECCAKKKVGGVSYNLLLGIFDGEIPHECLNDCVYTVSGTSSPKFCFKRGDRETECLSNQAGLQPIHAVSENSTEVSCEELKNMHQAIGRARVAYHCSNKPATGKQTECDQQLLQNLHSCSSADSGYCIFQLIAEEEVCYPPDHPEEICEALHRIYSFLLYSRQAFCQRPDSRSGCSWWKKLGCTAGVLAAGAGCTAVDHGAVGKIFSCVKGVLGHVSSCIPCICGILGGGIIDQLCEHAIGY